MNESERPLWREHVGLLVTTSTFGVIVLRLLGISGWDPQTAAAVVSAGGATNVALAVAVASVSQVATIACILGAFVVGRAAGRAWKAWWGNYWQSLTMSILVGLFILPLVVILGSIVIGLLSAASTARESEARPPGVDDREQDDGDRESGRTPAGTWGYFLPVWLVLMVVLFSQVPYLPAESFERADGSTYTGYVVGREEGFIVVLDDDSLVTREPSDVKHEFCQRDEDPDFLGVTVTDLVRDRDYPRCPRSES